METHVTIVVPESPRRLDFEHHAQAEARIETLLSMITGADANAAVRYSDGIDSEETVVLLWLTDTPSTRVDLSNTRAARRAFKNAVSTRLDVPSYRVDVSVSRASP